MVVLKVQLPSTESLVTPTVTIVFLRVEWSMCVVLMKEVVGPCHCVGHCVSWSGARCQRAEPHQNQGSLVRYLTLAVSG